MFPKTGNELHNGSDEAGAAAFKLMLAATLSRELGSTHRAAKTLMGWTGASERTVKHWLAGTHSPSAAHLISLARHSDAIMAEFLMAAGRPGVQLALLLISFRTKLLELLELMDRGDR